MVKELISIQISNLYKYFNTSQLRFAQTSFSMCAYEDKKVFKQQFLFMNQNRRFNYDDKNGTRAKEIAKQKKVMN